MTSLFTNSDQILSCSESWDDELFGDTASGGDGITTETGQVIAVRVGNFFDEFQVAQTFQIPGDASGGQLWEKRFEVGAPQAADITQQSEI